MIKTRIVKCVGHIHNMQLCMEIISFINNENESLLRWFYSFVTRGILAGSFVLLVWSGEVDLTVRSCDFYHRFTCNGHMLRLFDH